MAVGQSSLMRANSGLNARKVVSDSAQPSDIIEVNLSDLVYEKRDADEKLVQSIRDNGLICPIVAVKSGDKLKVIDGAGRLSALEVLGEKMVKLLVVDGNADALKKELGAFKKSSTAAKAKSVATEDIHEEKFKAVSGIYTTLPDWLL